jgi:hypothetical protein
MSEKGYEPDIERRRFNVAEVPRGDIRTPRTWHIAMPVEEPSTAS